MADEQEERKAAERVNVAFKRLQYLGIVDEKGELLSHEFPARGSNRCEN